MIDMMLPCEEKIFLKNAEEFLRNIYRSNKNFDEKKKI